MIMSETVEKLPERYRKDIEKAVEILKSHGCTEVYLFGSLVDGDYNEKVDIDLAVRGLEDKLYFRTWAEIDRKIKRDIDLIDLDDEKFDNKVQFILQESELVRIG